MSSSYGNVGIWKVTAREEYRRRDTSEAEVKKDVQAVRYDDY